jgi:hypothetical protein
MKKADSSHERMMAADLAELRDLAHRLKSVASTADDPMLRAILGKREALMDSIRARLAEAGAFEPPEVATDAGSDERRYLYDAVSEIVAMDRESARVLKDRADKVAAEIQKLRVGRQLRESARLWK